jgi:hypothetical protein
MALAELMERHATAREDLIDQWGLFHQHLPDWHERVTFPNISLPPE